MLRKGVDPKRIMKLRWVLTWKDPPEEEAHLSADKRAKARLVVIGYQDPDLTEIPRDSPTLATRTRLVFFAICALLGWSLHKGDIKTAFLTGDKSEAARQVYGEPTKELRERLGLDEQYVL